MLIEWLFESINNYYIKVLTKIRSESMIFVNDSMCKKDVDLLRPNK